MINFTALTDVEPKQPEAEAMQKAQMGIDTKLSSTTVSKTSNIANLSTNAGSNVREELKNPHTQVCIKLLSNMKPVFHDSEL